MEPRPCGRYAAARMEHLGPIAMISLQLLVPVVLVWGGYRLVRRAVRVELEERDRRNRESAPLPSPAR